MVMERGEVWWADLPQPAGRRPVVLLSRSKAIQIRSFVIVAEVTSVIRNIPVEVPLGPEDGLPKKCVINLDVINTIPKELLKERIVSLKRDKIAALNKALKFALDL
jgi:mRNA interferase MazF